MKLKNTKAYSNTNEITYLADVAKLQEPDSTPHIVSVTGNGKEYFIANDIAKDILGLQSSIFSLSDVSEDKKEFVVNASKRTNAWTKETYRKFYRYMTGNTIEKCIGELIEDGKPINELRNYATGEIIYNKELYNSLRSTISDTLSVFLNIDDSSPKREYKLLYKRDQYDSYLSPSDVFKESVVVAPAINVVKTLDIDILSSELDSTLSKLLDGSTLNTEWQIQGFKNAFKYTLDQLRTIEIPIQYSDGSICMVSAKGKRKIWEEGKKITNALRHLLYLHEYYYDFVRAGNYVLKNILRDTSTKLTSSDDIYEWYEVYYNRETYIELSLLNNLSLMSKYSTRAINDIQTVLSIKGTTYPDMHELLYNEYYTGDHREKILSNLEAMVFPLTFNPTVEIFRWNKSGKEVELDILKQHKGWE